MIIPTELIEGLSRAAPAEEESDWYSECNICKYRTPKGVPGSK